MTTPRHRSAVTNGKRLHVVPAGDTAWARRFKDVLAEITNDLGGVDLLSEGQRQLIRRVATISIACEAMEGDAAAGAAIDLELYGRLTDRLGRALERLGLKRQPREVSGMNGPLPYSPMRARFEAEAAAETEESEMSKDAFYQKTRRECAALLRFDDVDNLTADQATRLDCVVALRLCVDAMQSQLLRGEAVDTNKLLAATQELRRFLPEPEETQITGESARQRLLQVVLNLIAAEDAEASAAASQMEASAAALEGPGGAQELARLRAKSEPITPPDSAIIEPSQFAIGGCRPGPDDPPRRSNVVIDVKPNPPAAPAPAYNYETQTEWRQFIRGDGSIRSTPRGRWDPI